MTTKTESTTSNRYLVVLGESLMDKDWCYEDKAEARNKLVWLKKKYPNDNYEMVAVEDIKTNCGFGDLEGDEVDVNVTVTGLINGEHSEGTFNVQMCNGYHLSQMGCWITTNGGDGEFSFLERILYTATEVVDVAESYCAAHKAENITYHDTGFNASANSQSVAIKEERDGDDATFTILLVNDDFNRNDYNMPETKGIVFDNLEEAKEWLDDHRGDEHYDFEGLKRVISLINDHNNC